MPLFLCTRNQISVLLPVSLLIVILTIWGCKNQDPIFVGFSGQLTGKHSDLGVQGRNGAQLAIEKVNAAGGVHGRPLKLLSADDTNTKEGAVDADISLLDQGALAIIGHMTSAMSLATLDAVQKAGGILIAPTTSTSLLTGKKDAFFRVMSDTTRIASALADHAYTTEGATSVFVVSDKSNAGYSEVFSASFMHRYRELGGIICEKYDFSSRSIKNWDPIIDRIVRRNPARILAICSAKDLAALAQLVHIKRIDIKILSSPWAYTKEIVQMGGKTVDGIQFVAFYSDDIQLPRFTSFKREYADRFGYEPNFAAAFSYESILALRAALNKTGGKREGLHNALASLDVGGVMGDFTINEFGDVERTEYITTIKNGTFVTLAVVEK